MRFSRRELAFFSYAARITVSTILSLLLAAGPDLAAVPAAPQATPVQITLTAFTLPSQGQAGTAVIYVTGAPYPTGTIPTANVSVSFAAICGGAAVAITTASALQLLYGSTRRAQVPIPASLSAGIYFVSVSGTTSTGTPFASSNCSQVTVTSAVGPAAKLVFSTEPGNGVAGSALGNVLVQVQDANGKLVTSSNASITMTSTAAGVGGATTVAAVNGVATFSNLVFTTAGSYTLTAAATGVASATSTPFTISAGAAFKLVFSTEPVNGTAGSPLANVVVQVEDANGNLVTGSNALITITSTAAGVGGTTAVAAVNGVATFSNLMFTLAGSYTLMGGAAGLPNAISTPFTIGSGAPAKLVFSTEPANGTAANGLASVVVKVQDSNGNLVTGSNALITITSTALGVAGTTTVAAANGVATFGSLVFNATGTYTLTATAAGVTSATSTPFTISAGTPSKLVFSTEPANGTAAIPLASVVVKIQDSNGNLVTGSNALITITSTATGIGGATTVAAGNGVATFSNLVFNVTGTYTLTATAAGVTSATSTPFIIGAGAASKLVFSTEPLNGTAGSPLAPVVVQIQDAFGNLTNSNAQVTITSSAPGVGGITTVTAINGVAAFSNLQFATDGIYTFMAASTGVTSATSTPFTISSGTVSKLVFTIEPMNGTAGTPLAVVVVQIQDAFGNLTSSNAPVTITSAVPGVGGTTTVTATNGVATFTNLSFTADGTYTLMASSTGVTSATSTPFTISSSTAAMLVFSTEPVSGTAGTPLATVVVQIQDAFGNLTNSNAQVTITSSAPGVGGTTTVTAINGVATFSDLLFTAGGTYTLTAASTGAANAVSSPFTITVGAPAVLVFTSQPPSPAQTLQAIKVQVTMEDSLGNVVTSFNGAVTISIGNNPGGAILGGTLSQNAVNGVATFPNLSLNAAGNGYTLVASATGLTATSNPFNVTVSPDLAACKEVGSLAVQIQGNTVNSYVPNGFWIQTLSGEGFSVSFEGKTGVQLVPIEGNGPRASIATPNSVNSCASNSVTGETLCTSNHNDVYLIKDSALSATLQSSASTFFRLDFSGGSCSTCGVAINPVTNQAVIAMGVEGLIPGTSVSSTSGIQLLDLSTNKFSPPIFTNGVQISEEMSIDPRRNLMLSASEYGYYEIFKLGQSVTVFDNNATTTLNPGGGALTLDASAEDCTTGIALGSQEGAPDIYLADLTQAIFTTTPNVAGGYYAVPNPTWTAPGQLQPLPELLNLVSGGVQQFVRSGIAVAPGSHFGLETGEFGGNGFGVFQLPSTSGSGIPSIVDYVGGLIPTDPSGTPWAYGLDPHTTTAYVSPIDGKPYGLVANTQSVTAAGIPFGTESRPTYLAVLDLQGLLKAPRTSAHTIDPSVDLVATGLIRFVPVYAPATQLAFVSQPQNAAAGEPQAIQIAIEDAQGLVNPDDPLDVTVSASGGATLFSTSVTDTVGGLITRAVDGVATYPDLAVLQPGTYTLTASAPGLPSVTSSPFVIAPNPAARLVFTSQPATTVAGVPMPAVQVAVEDATGNVITGVPYLIRVLATGLNASSGTLLGTLSQTTINGIATFIGLSIDQVGRYQIFASSNVSPGSNLSTTSNAFDIVPGSPAQLAFIAQPFGQITAGQRIVSLVGLSFSNVQVAVEDSNGNVITTASNTISIAVATSGNVTLPANTLTGTTSQLEVNGVATFADLSVNKSGGYELVASTAGLSPVTSFPFAVTAGPAAQLVFTTLPVSAGQSSLVNVAIEDALGNAVIFATNPVTLSLGTNPASGTLSGTTTATPSSGIASFNVSIDKAGVGYTLAASSPGLPMASSPAFTVSAGAPSQLVFLTQPNSVEATQPLNPVQVAVEDASANVVATSTGTVSITLDSNPTLTTLSGTLTAPIVNGIATFSGLSIGAPGNAYSLVTNLLSCCSAVSNSFNVLPTSPTILSLSPNGALQGASLQVTITALNTHFVQGQTAANFGPGISVGGGVSGDFGPVQVTSATTAIAQVSVAANAALGLYTVAVRTGSEEASLLSAFGVSTPPSLSDISPGFGQPGQQGVLVTIKGSFTNFKQSVTQATFGPGISVGGAPEGGPGPVDLVIDATTAIVVLAINAAATPGLRPVTVQTGAELATLQSGGFLVLSGVTGAFPFVSIDSPTEGAEITSPTLVTGKAISANLATWTLDYQGSDSTTFTTFATGTSSTVSATFDPTLLLNGLAVIRLTAVDQSGQTASTVLNVAVARKLKVGVFTVSFNDLTIPVAGIPIQITRTYDSRFKGVGDFGFGWTLSIKSMKVSTNGPLGNNWQGATLGTELVPVYCIQQAQNHIVTIRLPGDTLYQFQPVLTAGVVDFQGDTQPGCQYFGPLQTVNVTFVPVGATPANAKLTAVSGMSGEDLFVSGTFPLIDSGDPPQPIQLVDSVTGISFDPDQFQLTLPTGQTFVVSRTFGVQSVTDTNNNTLTITSAGITSSTGKRVSFARDAQNRISSITDPMGHVLSYQYDGNGDLTTFTDQLQNISTFTYDSAHDLLSFTNPKGVQPLQNVYDDSGRLIEQVDASGNVQDFNHLTDVNTEAWTDFLGNTTTYVYDGHGNIIRETDPLGNVTTRTFDANDNLLSETNALGQTRSYTYDASNNLLSQTDPLVNTTKYTYNSLNKPLTITDPLGNTQTNTYDANGNLLTMTDALGNTTKVTYDPGGNQISRTDPLGHTTNYGYDSYGNLATVTDPAGTMTTYTFDFNGNRISQSVARTTLSGSQTLNTLYSYDSANHLIATTLPDGSTVRKSYDSTGKVSSTVDELGRTTSYAYDSEGHLTSATYPDNTQGLSTYDANGNRTHFTGPSGATLSFAYDAVGRVTTAANSTGGTTSTLYDAVGNAISVSDPRGNVARYAYDADGRRTSITNAMHQVTSFVFDGAGNQASGTDANGNTTTIQHDNDNRVVKIIYPDGTFDQKTYDAAGRLVSKTDPAGNTTQYGFDSVGRLIAVTDALGHITKFAYDELGNRISQTDANGHTTTFQYDQRGRRTRRTLPAGQTESFAYDAAGNLVSHTDFNGKTTTYSYDSRNQLLSKVPDPSFNAPTVTFTYTPSGKRASMTDATGTSTYQYDSGERLMQVVKPNGTISYTYDFADNLISLNGGGTQVSYAYDALNRLGAVTETNTGATSYDYDAVGNLATVTYPNGVTSAYTYNAKNELTNLGIGKGGGSFAGYTYTLDAAGHRLSVAELNGRTVQYTYDQTYQLTSENIAGAPSGPNGSVGYTYDAVGNRTQTASTLAGVPPGAFSYDANDRLSRDTYDPDGNTISSNGIGNTYDFENRLVQHGGVTIVYDGDGNRVSKTIGGVTTKYLVDDLSPAGFPQVIAETSSDGSSRAFVYGLQRISQRLVTSNSKNVVTSFYGYDGHGSVRALTDSTGTVTDTYDYDAFGNLIKSTGSTPNEFLFAGEQFDSDLGLYYNRARYFDPTSGRFWTMDAMEGNAQSPSSLHRYLYGGGDPVNRIDPSGNQTLGEVMESVAIQLVLSEAASIVLNTPLGQNVVGLIASQLLPAGLIQAPETLTLDAVSIAFGFSANPTLGLTITGGAELLIGMNLKTAGYVYLGGGINVEGRNAGVSLGLGLVFDTPKSTGYGGPFLTFTLPLSALPAKVVSALFNQWQIAEYALLTALLGPPIPTVAPLPVTRGFGGGLGQLLLKTYPAFPSLLSSVLRNTSISLFGDPGGGSKGASFAVSQSTRPTPSSPSFTVSGYVQVSPDVNFR